MNVLESLAASTSAAIWPDPDTNPEAPLIAMLLSVTTVDIPLPPENVKVSLELKVSLVPESAAKVKDVEIPAISEAIEAEVEVNDPEMLAAICAELERIPSPVELMKFASLFSCDIAEPDTMTFFQLAIIYLIVLIVSIFIYYKYVKTIIPDQ